MTEGRPDFELVCQDGPAPELRVLRGLRGLRSPTAAGDRYGLLTALSFVDRPPGGQGPRWLFDCDCGDRTILRLKDVRHGTTASCGCAKAGNGKRGPRVETAMPRPWAREKLYAPPADGWSAQRWSARRWANSMDRLIAK